MQRNRGKPNGKTGDLFKKTRYQGNISSKDGHKKGQKGQDLTEAEEIKKRRQEHIELYKKGLNKLDDRTGVFTHLHQTSWSTKASGSWEALLRTKLMELSYFKS